MIMGPDVQVNRRMRKWTVPELAGRALWALVRPTLFALSPRFFWGWRRLLLRWFGAKIGRDVHIYPSVRIAVPWNLVIGAEAGIGDGAILYSLGLIRIGKRATISQHAHLCAGTHDHRRADFALQKLPITVGDEAWICADAFVGPGVTIGERAIVGARGVAVKDVASNSIVAGNPAKKIKDRPLVS